MSTSQPPALPGRTGRGRPARYTRDDLLAVVVGVFNERGYDGTSMEDLAAATGLTKSSFYHHVSGKQELLDLAVGRALDSLEAVFGEPAATEGTPVRRLQHVIRRTAEVLVAELPYVTLLLRVRGNTDPERRALERRRELDSQVAALMSAAAEAGQIRSDVDLRMTTRLIFGMVNSITEWYRPTADRRSAATPDIAATVVELAMDGLRAERGPTVR